ncbi:uncharacterized protein [Periplaneta americana]|uniref:uncharacterized protein isoform X2 n=1 Tax=Periplaneta americana TaxID=6978 RepID=UPI0037E79DED
MMPILFQNPYSYRSKRSCTCTMANFRQHIIFLVFIVLLGQNLKSVNASTDEEQEMLLKSDIDSRGMNENLEALLKGIIENGLPAAGIPPLDPLHISGIRLNNTDLLGTMQITTLNLEEVTVVGLKNYIKHVLKVSLVPLGITFNLTLPLTADGTSLELDITIGEVLPFNGNGTVHLETAITLAGTIGIKNTPVEKFIYIDKLDVDLVFNSLQIEVSSLLGMKGNKIVRILNKLLGDSTVELIEFMKPYVLPDLLESLRNMVNDELLAMEITFSDLTNCFISNICPF